MQPDDKELKRATLHSFFRSSFKEKKHDITASHIGQPSQIPESDTIAFCSTNEPLESVSLSLPIPSSSPISSTSPSLSPLSSSASPCSSSTSPPCAHLTATNISLIPSDISYSPRESPTQPKLASYT